VPFEVAFPPASLGWTGLYPVEEESYRSEVQEVNAMDRGIRLLNIGEVEKLLSMPEVLKLVEQAFLERGKGRVQMPPKSYVFFRKNNGDLRVMPAYLEAMDEPGVKMVNVHPDNQKKHGNYIQFCPS